MRIESILALVVIMITVAACTLGAKPGPDQGVPPDTIPSEGGQTPNGEFPENQVRPGEWQGQPPGNLTGRDMTRDGRPSGNFSGGMGPGGSEMENASLSACQLLEEGATCELSTPRGTVSGTCQTREGTEGRRCVPKFNRP